ncbi:MAG: NifU N-terminal domain-containing protein [Planctomycetota bacterium]
MTRFEETPNPRAIKCLLDPAPSPIGAGMRSYADAAQARDAEDELATALFGIDGVERVMVLNDFATVTRAEAAKWSAIKPAIKKTLGAIG